MPPTGSSFTALNLPDDIELPECMESFSLAAPPNTDLWRKPPFRDTSTAPILYTALRQPFISAQVRIMGDWELEWDQAGLVIFAGAPPGSLLDPIATNDLQEAENTLPIIIDINNIPEASNQEADSYPLPPSQCFSDVSPTPLPTQRTQSPPSYYVSTVPAVKWVKVGLEFCSNECHATSVVANSEGADWALTALPLRHGSNRSDLRIKLERIGYALWVWYEDEMSGWKKLRDVTWFFWGVEDKAVRVGVYASRPANFGGSEWDRRHGTGSGGATSRNLYVDFEGLEIY